jgi:FixJ family two-component response regulator
MRHRCELAGAFGFLLKPLHGDVLLETVKSALARNSAEQNAGNGVK